jgi:uridylate kinase
MDSSAVSLMRDNNIPIVVFSLKEEGSLLNVLHGRGKSTTISNKGGVAK